jgi:CRP-like cAMP-binding protein
MKKQQYSLMQIIQKISLFKGLDLEHIQRLLRRGTSKSYGIGERVYTVDEPSDEMLVLLKGKLVVTSAGGEELAAIWPGMITGEMGVFTNHLRSANITAVEASVAIVIGQKTLVSFWASDNTVHICMLDNVVEILSERIRFDNSEKEALKNRITKLEGEEEDDFKDVEYDDDGEASELDESSVEKTIEDGEDD